MQRPTLILRLVILLSVALALLVGLGAGLARLGVSVDALSAQRGAAHGPLMISGFLGTLICMERAVALAALGPRYRFVYFVPLLSALGTVILLLGGISIIGKGLLLLAAIGLMSLFGIMWRRHPAPYIGIMALGAFSWLAGNFIWTLDQPIYQTAHWWVAFLVLTITGERLELSRIQRLSSASQRALLVISIAYILSVGLTLANLDIGVRAVGISLIAVALWLLRFDIAGKAVQKQGLPRYVATCLLIGYIWLLVGGVVGILSGAVYAGPIYELLLHSVLLGFVFSMIFGHAPIILPSLTGLQISFNPLLYLPLALLHLALAYRAYGDLAGDVVARQQGGIFNAVAILLFFALMVYTLLKSRRA
ncbi:MAG: hypothetical protein D6712_18170 [Chloroflexi bacterium]|nr:MAG: hypothetical protein D6712_18170 [Chloroflexota bacterium]